MANNSGIFYIGSYGEAANPTVYGCRLDSQSGKLKVFQRVAGIEQASFLTVHPSGNVLYACSETGETRGEPGGSVYALSLDPSTGELEVLEDQLTHGEHPCYVSVSSDGLTLYAANYSGGNAAVFPLSENGRLEEPASAVIASEGELGPNRDRQDKAHAHSAAPIPGTPFVYVADLGTDTVYIHRRSADGRSLLTTSALRVEPGSGPRHVAVREGSSYIYIMGELDSHVTVAQLGSEGTLETVQRLSALPEGYAGESWAADIHLSDDGRFLYTSNRGHDSIAVFAVQQHDGRLEPIQHISTGGSYPRNFALSPDGQWLLAANQNSGSVNVLRRDPHTGLLEATNTVLNVPSPVCIQFL
ncbi:lactonase family protein [Paenibacillus pasadenensis]|uniref:lactonase family protein n=1 Tax=Paenibacillus pasadenensis TaxID=217090 RepID=UPI00203FDC76|nr:lactonase family protein [Paenibacillus pasadenensis]MCM3748670.1 lactonase family protein [Paenibacillus pasadenensis]